MMKKLLLFFAIMLVSIAKAQFPLVGILGTATTLGWSGTQPDIAMSTTDGIRASLIFPCKT
jgi:starch-binding outer membrane protein SusE/F